MDITPGLAPTPPSSPFVPPKSDRERERERDRDDDQPAAPAEPSSFSRALAQVEGHRRMVRRSLGIAVVARLILEFKLLSLVRHPAGFIAELPAIGLALLSYLVVRWFLAARTRDRFGFGMALGIGVLETTYLGVMMAMIRPLAMQTMWPLLVVAAAHLPMAIFALHASTAYPPYDSKRPWLVGFGTALIFLAIPWVAPGVMEMFGK